MNENDVLVRLLNGVDHNQGVFEIPRDNRNYSDSEMKKILLGHVGQIGIKSLIFLTGMNPRLNRELRKKIEFFDADDEEDESDESDE